MIQLLDFMILMVGMYIITKMTIYLFKEKTGEYNNFTTIINKILSVFTIAMAIVCMILAILSFIDTLDISSLERMLHER